MALVTEVGLGPGHIVLYGNPGPPPKKGHNPHFSAHVYCGQTAGWMPLGTKVGLGPGNIVLDADPTLSPKGHSPLSIFGLCLLWPNGWMDQDTTSFERRPRPRPHCITWGSVSTKKGIALPQFSATAEHLFTQCSRLNNR